MPLNIRGPGGPPAKPRRRVGLFVAALIAAPLIVGLAGCADGEPAATAGATSATPSVPVLRPARASVPRAFVLTGRVEAVERVEIRPRVSGYLTAVRFDEGAAVRAGDALFEIDNRPYVARRDEAAAQVRAAEATAALARVRYERSWSLSEKGVASADEGREARAAYDAAEAGVAARQAELAAAELDLEFTKVQAPLPGKLGRALVTEGNLVEAGPGGGTLLTTIVGTDPLHILFDVDEPTYRALVRARREGSGQAIEVGSDDGMLPATLDFVANELDRDTATAEVRAVVANASGELAPGMFVRGRLLIEADATRLLVPETSIGADQGRRYVLIVGPDGSVEYRGVKLGPRHGAWRVIDGGLAVEDQVVVGDLQKLQPGTRVTPVPAGDAPAMDF